MPGEDYEFAIVDSSRNEQSILVYLARRKTTPERTPGRGLSARRDCRGPGDQFFYVVAQDDRGKTYRPQFSLGMTAKFSSWCYYQLGFTYVYTFEIPMPGLAPLQSLQVQTLGFSYSAPIESQHTPAITSIGTVSGWYQKDRIATGDNFLDVGNFLAVKVSGFTRGSTSLILSLDIRNDNYDETHVSFGGLVQDTKGQFNGLAVRGQLLFLPGHAVLRAQSTTRVVIEVGLDRDGRWFDLLSRGQIWNAAVEAKVEAIFLEAWDPRETEGSFPVIIPIASLQ